MTNAPGHEGGEPRVVIRPAGASATGVRVSSSAAGAVAGAAAGTAARPKAKAKGKGRAKARKPAQPRRPLSERLRARLQGIRFRILPITIFVAVLLLGVRVGDVWRLVGRDVRLPEFPASLAENRPAQPSQPSPARQPQQQVAANDPAKAAAPAQGGASGGPAPAVPGQGAPGENGALGPVTNQELLQHFADRRAEIERRTKEVEQREALLAAAEKRIDQKIQELDKVRADIQKLMRQGDEKQAAQLDSLVKIYETMKPKEAARIFEELDMPVLLGVIERMKEQKTAPVLAAMDPVKAKEVTSALVERRALPSVPQ